MRRVHGYGDARVGRELPEPFEQCRWKSLHEERTQDHAGRPLAEPFLNHEMKRVHLRKKLQFDPDGTNTLRDTLREQYAGGHREQCH